MRRLLIGLMACSALIGACASLAPSGPPTDEDVSSLETWRVLEPDVSVTRDGSRFVEFAPSVETRSIACIADGSAYMCAYESRTKAWGEATWAPWTAKTMRVTWDVRSGRWVATLV